MTSDLIFLGVITVAILVLILVSAEFADDVKRFERWAGRLFMPVTGAHASGPAEVTDPAREVAESARRMPPGMENPVAAGAAPVPSETGAAHPRFGRLASTPPDGMPAVGGFPVTYDQRPHWRATGPLIASPTHPPWMTAPFAAVPAAEEPGHAWDAGDGIEPPVALARPYAPQVTRPLGLADLGPAGERSFAERVKPS